MATPERHVSTVSMLLSPEPNVVVEYPNAGPCASAQACVVQKQQTQRKTIRFIARPRPRKSEISRSAYNRANLFCSPQSLDRQHNIEGSFWEQESTLDSLPLPRQEA